jgi:polar amino acid transport system substrate-binding protein
MKMKLSHFAVLLAMTLPASAGAQEIVRVPNFLGPNDASGIGPSDSQQGIQFLTTLDFPPFSFLDETGRLNGFNVYLAKLVCAELSLEDNCTIQGVPWDDLEPALARGQGNAVIAGMASTEAARLNYGFSKPYLRLPARFAALKTRTSDDDFDTGLAGSKIGVLAQSAHEANARSYFPNAEITGYASDERLIADLQAGKINLIFGDGMRLAFFLSTETGSSCCRFVGGPYFSSDFLGEGMRIAVPVEQEKLQEQINHALISLQRKGKIEELYLRFFPEGFY